MELKGKNSGLMTKRIDIRRGIRADSQQQDHVPGAITNDYTSREEMCTRHDMRVCHKRD